MPLVLTKHYIIIYTIKQVIPEETRAPTPPPTCPYEIDVGNPGHPYIVSICCNCGGDYHNSEGAGACADGTNGCDGMIYDDGNSGRAIKNAPGCCKPVHADGQLTCWKNLDTDFKGWDGVPNKGCYSHQ